MTAGGARVAERLPRDRHELPAVARVVERELQDAEAAAAPDLAVRPNRAERHDFGAARAHDELPDPLCRVGHAGRRLRREPLVERVVRIHHHIHARAVQHVPQRSDGGVGGILGVEQWVVPVGEGAARRVRGQVGTQPLDLRRRGRRRDQLRAAAVQHDDVPGAEVVAVVALLWVARGGSIVAEVPRCVSRLVVALTGRRLGARLVPSPAQVVAAVVLGKGAVVVGGIAGREHGAGDAVEQHRCGVISGRAALRDVAGADEGYWARCRGNARCRSNRRFGRRSGPSVVAAGRDHDQDGAKDEEGPAEPEHRRPPKHEACPEAARDVTPAHGVAGINADDQSALAAAPLQRRGQNATLAPHQWHEPLPESVAVWPATGTNCQL